MLDRSITTRVLLYYILLFGAAAILWRILPVEQRAALVTPRAVTSTELLSGTADSPLLITHRSAVVEALVAMIAAVALALPVAWVYMFTRQKKGYRQTMVHSLLLLPIVVAGIVVLVKDSLPLAFGLAGIVAAVRFRSTLEDSKDAVAMFLGIAIGLAAAVRLEVAAVLSVGFNALTLVLWQSDFARTPPGLEEERAQKHLARAMAIANRTSEFVARLDREILDSLAPEQLDALQARIRKQREKVAPDMPGPDGTFPASRLLVTTASVDAARRALEPNFPPYFKQWELLDERDGGDGVTVLEYEVKTKRELQPAVVREALVRLVGAHATDIELV